MFRTLFSREGIPLVLVAGNGIHFTADYLVTWVKGLGCRHLLTAPRHPQSNGLAENFVKTLKAAISSMQHSTFTELDRSIDNFLMQYRNADQATTGKSPVVLFKGRKLNTSFQCLKSGEVTFFKGNDFRPSRGLILGRSGNRMVTILDVTDLSSHRRHVDQIRFDEAAMPVIDPHPSEPAVPATDSYSSEPADPANTTPSVLDQSSQALPRRSERLVLKSPVNYRMPSKLLHPGGCRDC